MNDVSNWVTGLLKDNPVIARNFMQVYEQFSNSWSTGCRTSRCRTSSP